MLGTPDALSTALRLIDDPVAEVRTALAAALERFAAAGPEVDDALSVLASDSDERVRDAAQRSITMRRQTETRSHE